MSHLAILLSGHELRHLLAVWGYAAVFAFVAIESLGVPFPGETALISAAIYAATTHAGLEIGGVIAAAAAGAVIGDNIGYATGRASGWRLIRRYGERVHLTESRAKLARYLFLRHGGKVVFFGRFLTGLRTWAAFLAGMNGMPRRRFLVANALGGVVWATLYGLGYFYLGSTLEHASAGLDVAVGAAVVAMILGWASYLRRNEQRLTRRAELALPGRLEPGSRPLDAEQRRRPSSATEACGANEAGVSGGCRDR